MCSHRFGVPLLPQRKRDIVNNNRAAALLGRPIVAEFSQAYQPANVRR